MSEKTRWGIDNPHPLSRMKTELVWEGKYDEYGNRRTVDVAGCAMPLQKIETIDEPHSRARAQGTLFEPEKAHRDDFRNMLIWGDNKLVMASLLKDFKGKIDLIYIDPPFDVGADFTMDVPVGDERETVNKDQSTLERVAYSDIWGKGTDSYLYFMHERLLIMRDLLSEAGSIFVHSGVSVSHYLRVILENIFGKQNEIEEIIWYYGSPSGGRAAANKLIKAHDYIISYAKSYGKHIYNRQHLPYSEKYIRDWFKWEENGRKYRKRMRGSRREGNVTWERQFLDESKGMPLSSVWSDIQQVYADPRAYKKGTKSEVLPFPTQKSEKLSERIIEMATEKGALVADFFCGSGTMGAVAEKLGRRWIMCDLGRYAIHTSRKRLIEIQRELHARGEQYRSFDVYNLGRYERQWWQRERLQGADKEHRRVVLEFYRAEPLPNASGLLHGRKGGALVHVDGIDSIFTREEAGAVAKAAEQAGAKEVHCLAWEFEMDLKLECLKLEAEHGIKIKLIPIPREIMEKNRTSPPPFLEVAVLEAEPVYKQKGKQRTVDIKLTKFLPSLAEVPSKELEALKERAIKSGFDFIDFWAIDFDWHEGKPFEHHWQDYRTRKDRSLKTVSDFGFDRYPSPGSYKACVKVIDVFGCDTSISVEVKV